MFKKKEKKMDIFKLVQTMTTHPEGIKGAVPEMLTPAIKEGQTNLKTFLESIPLIEGETHCTVVTQFKEDGTLFFIVASFKDKTFSRVFGTYTPEFLLKHVIDLM